MITVTVISVENYKYKVSDPVVTTLDLSKLICKTFGGIQILMSTRELRIGIKHTIIVFRHAIVIGQGMTHLKKLFLF